MNGASLRRLGSFTLTIAVIAAAASSTRLLGQTISLPERGAVEKVGDYLQLSWIQEEFLPPPEVPADGPKPLLVLTDLLDLRGHELRFAGNGAPRQATFVAREIILGDGANVSLRGLTGKEAHPDGGFLVLVADTLRLEATAESPIVLQVDASAGGSGLDQGDDGGMVIVFRRLILGETLSREICRPVLESADFIPADSQGKIRLEPLDRALLGVFFDQHNAVAQRLQNDAQHAWDQQALRDEIQRACQWEIEQAPGRVVHRLVRLRTSWSLSSLPPAKLLEHELESTHIATSFGALAEIIPIGRVLTLWSTAYFEYLRKLLEAAAARGDAASIDTILDRFKAAPDYLPDPALRDAWSAARNPLRRALAYYRPASPGSRIVTRLPPNVVLIEALSQDPDQPSKPGCGFVVGRSQDEQHIHILTAGHVVNDAGAVHVTFWSDDLTPRPVARRDDAIVVPPQGDVAIDLALLSVPAPPGWSWKKDVDGDSAKLAVHSAVWSLSIESGVVLPALDVGVVRFPADKTGIIEAEGVVALGGNSGCPLVADSGIVGMLVERSQEGEAQALPIALIRETVREHWGIPWGLSPPSPENQLP